MTKTETRIIKSSIMTGLTEMLIGLFMWSTGWHVWYYEHFHFFGIIGIGMFVYGAWHTYYYYKEVGEMKW